MKSHKSKLWPAMSGMNDTDDSDRIPDDEASFLLNGYCDPTGKVAKYPGTYPSVLADALGVSADTGKAKVHVAARFRGKTSIQRAVAVVGNTFLRSLENNLFDPWEAIAFPAETSTPALNRAAAIIFRNRYAYHQNGVDLPFRVQMERDDLSPPSSAAEILGLLPPTWLSDNGTETPGERFPVDRRTTYAYTYVYGDRGESGPSPMMTFTPAASADVLTWTDVPDPPANVTAVRWYRTKIGAGRITPTSSPREVDTQLVVEMFFHSEIPASQAGGSFADGLDDAALDYSRRCPPPRPMPPVAYHQTVHQDHIVWGNLRDHPWVLLVSSIEGNSSLTAATITISNSGNGTITLNHDIGAGLVTIITVSDYKTKTLFEIQSAIMGATWSNQAGGGGSGSNFVARILPGVDGERTYRFKEVTDRDIYLPENAMALEAIDDENDSVVVDGGEYFPNRVMWSNLAFPEEINPLNFVDVSRHDVYPIHALFRDDYTLGLMTENDIWLITGSLSVNPETFAPDFSLARSQSEHGNFCTRPDSIAQTPAGIVFVAKDGVRIFRGQSSRPFARQIRRRLMDRLIPEPRTRDNLCMLYENGKLYIAFAGREVA